MPDSRPVRLLWAGAMSLAAALAVAACSSPSGEVCETNTDCQAGYECVSTGGVVFGEKLCLLTADKVADVQADAADVGPDAASDASTDASVDAGDDDASDVSDADAQPSDAGETGEQDTCGLPCTVDTDGDGIVDAHDGCPERANPYQRDRDGDGVQDACDPELSVKFEDAVFPGPEQGCCGGEFPWRVVGGGDLTGDGRDDIIIAGHQNGDFAVWVIDGTTTPAGTVDLSSAHATFTVAQEGSWGLRVANPGDVNGDGVDDLLIGHPGANNEGGRAMLYLGGAQLQGDLSSRLPDSVFYENRQDRVGFAVDIAPDVNGDGRDDIVVSEAFGGTNVEDGRVHIIFGRPSLPRSVELLPTDGADVRLLGSNNERAGWSVAGVGDVSGDGVGDLVIGAPQAGVGSGSAYLVFGDSRWVDAALQLDSDAIAFAPQDTRSRGLLGAAVSRAGDVNGDGAQDFLVGEPGARVLGVLSAGQVHLVLGGGRWSIPGRAVTIADHSIRATGTMDYGGLGASVSAVGDLDGDGYDDILIGAPGAVNPDGDADAGAVYLVHGFADTLISEGHAAAIDTVSRAFFGASAGVRLGASVAGAGDIDADGHLDLLMSAGGHDASLSASGAAFLFYGL